MKSISDISKTLAARIKKTIWILGLHAFPLILFLVFVDLVLGSFIFYNYVLLAEKGEPKVTENILRFDNKTYQDVLTELQARQKSNQESPAP
jgi:hypothetical protein